MIQIGFEIPGDNPVSKMISGLDAPHRFSHSAIWIAKDLATEAHIDFGVKFREYLPDPARWVFVPIPNLTAEQEEKIRRFCERTAGCKYDTCGALATTGVPFLKQDPDSYFCSEHCLTGLQEVGLFADLTPSLIRPNKLYLTCAQAGWVNDDQ